jgi:predicted nucleotidyltransferase
MMGELLLPDEERDALYKVTDSAREIFGEYLYSIIVYGSATRGAYIRGKSDLNLLIVLTKTDFDSFRRFSDIISQVHDKLLVEPYIVCRDELPNLANYFPTRLWDMRRSYVVITGEDVLANLNPDVSAIRINARRELFNLMLRLRHAIAVPPPPRGWAPILSMFLRAFTKSLRGLMLGLTGEQIEDRQELFSKASKQCGFNEQALLQMSAWRSGELHLTDDEILIALKLLLEAIEQGVSSCA